MRRLVTILDDSVSDHYMLTVPDLAAILNVDVSKARSMLAEGKIPGGMHVGKLWRVSARAVREWINSETLPKNPTVANIRAAARNRRNAPGGS